MGESCFPPLWLVPSLVHLHPVWMGGRTLRNCTLKSMGHFFPFYLFCFLGPIVILRCAFSYCTHIVIP